MRFALYQTLLAIGLFLTPSLWAQSTISDRAWELTTSKGLWGVFLPDYDLPNAVGPDYHDDLEDLGYIGETKLVRRFLGTRTSFETRGFYATADSRVEAGVSDIDVPNPETGAIYSDTGARPGLESEVEHYGLDFALRDTWRTRFGGLSAGCGFSYMRFDQEFDVDYGPTDLMRETLDSKYMGIKAIFGWDGCVCNRPSNLDLGIAFYDLNVDYHFSGDAIVGSESRGLNGSPVTLESSFTTRTHFLGYLLGLKVGAMYVSEMPIIRHRVGRRAGLDKNDAATLSGMIEILL